MSFRVRFRGMLRNRNGNGHGKRSEKAKRRTAAAKPSKVQLAAMDRILRDAEQENGVKVTAADVAAVEAELARVSVSLPRITYSDGSHSSERAAPMPSKLRVSS